MCKLYIVVPCYNEEEILQQKTFKTFEKLMTQLVDEKEISSDSRVCYVDDGSKDKTWELIVNNTKENKYSCGVKLSRNKGHQNALVAGLEYADKNDIDITISIDADLQDDINAIPKMIKSYKEGNEIVYGVRNSRKKDTFFKRATANGFYDVMEKLGVEIVKNHADFRLLGKRAVKKLLEYKEVNLFLRAIVPTLGYKSTNVYYERLTRDAGESKYPLKKMLSFAFEGITSFSIKPIKMISAIGVITVFVSFIGLIYALVSCMSGTVIKGWTSLFLSIWFLGGVQLISIGVVGEYIGKIYMETKARPRYFIEETIE